MLSLLLWSAISIAKQIELQSASNFHGPHLAYWDETKKAKLLLLTIGGTNSSPKDLAAIDETATEMGFDALAVDYDDHVISTDCQPSPDPLCFDKFRASRVEQGPESIEASTLKALETLAKQDVRWAAFLKDGAVNWSKVVALGFSQGSGHAAYLGKRKKLEAVIMLAGPQDHFDDGRTAPWVLKRGLTPPTHFYSFLHKQDKFDSDFQLKLDRVLMSNPSLPVRNVESPSDVSTRIWMTNRVDLGDFHTSLVKPAYQGVWRQMFEQVLKQPENSHSF